MDKVLVARAIFPDIVERLRAHFEVETNADDEVWGKAALIERLQGKAGAFTTGSERIDAEVLVASRGCARSATWRSATTTSTWRPAPHAA